MFGDTVLNSEWLVNFIFYRNFVATVPQYNLEAIHNFRAQYDFSEFKYQDNQAIQCHKLKNQSKKPPSTSL